MAEMTTETTTTEGQSQSMPTSIDALRELNRLLESALRMGGGDDGKNDASSSAVVDGSVADDGGGQGTAAGGGGDSWRLDTARRLGWLLSSQLNAIQEELENVNDYDLSDNPLLPALARQSRYWIPLLLSWVRQDCTDDDEDAFESSLSLKQRRRRHQHTTTTGRKYVQIESLRALNLLHEWMVRCEETEQPVTTNNNHNNNNTGQNAKKSNNIPTLTSQQPLSTPTQKLLLRHPDAVPIAISLLSSPDRAVMEQSTWILGSIASGGLETMSPPSLTCVANAAATAMRSGSENVSVAIPASSGGDDEDVKESNSGGSRKEKSGTLTARDAILAAGTLPALLECLDRNPHNIELHRIGVWCLSSLIEGRYSSSGSGGNSAASAGERKFYGEEIDVLALLPTLRRLLHMEDWEVLTYACWTLSHVCDGPASNINAVLYSENPSKKKGSTYFDPERGLVPRLIELLMHPYPKVVKPALRTIGNVVCAECTDSQHSCIPDYTEVILDLNAVPYLRDLVCHENREIQKESCWTLSNIAAGTISQIQAVIDSGVIPPLVELVSDPSTDKEVRSEACWVVLNATSCGSDEQIETLVEEGCVNVLGVLLAEPSMIMMSMEGLERVLQTEEAKDAADLRANNGSSMGIAQRPVIVICAKLINGVMELNHSSSAAAKRARFCHECKCHVCCNCDCRVYHLSYQEELWAEDDEKAEAKTKSKKNKKQKKKAARDKKKAAPPAKNTSAADAKNPPLETTTKTDLEKSKTITVEPSSSAKEDIQSKSSPPLSADNKTRRNELLPTTTNEQRGSRKASSSSPSRGTIDDDSASVGADNSGSVMNELPDSNHDEPIDLVLYLQQTGSIIALAKLMDSLYADEKFDDEEEMVGEEGPQMSVKQDITRAMSRQ
ncbi:hypothetical protein HJC23_006596 [Cyclotella cryptica]|uniref:Importin subunit alpha n=1 Tax=Cyclotella cryptica TaxID=29204 RepID=A0ABD3QXT2_9STRA